MLLHACLLRLLSFCYCRLRERINIIDEHRTGARKSSYALPQSPPPQDSIRQPLRLSRYYASAYDMLPYAIAYATLTRRHEDGYVDAMLITRDATAVSYSERAARRC